jgi:hypothetical protein
VDGRAPKPNGPGHEKGRISSVPASGAAAIVYGTSAPDVTIGIPLVGVSPTLSTYALFHFLRLLDAFGWLTERFYKVACQFESHPLRQQVLDAEKFRGTSAKSARVRRLVGGPRFPRFEHRKSASRVEVGERRTEDRRGRTFGMGLRVVNLWRPSSDTQGAIYDAHDESEDAEHNSEGGEPLSAFVSGEGEKQQCR